jgi:hypothetical protein
MEVISLAFSVLTRDQHDLSYFRVLELLLSDGTLQFASQPLVNTLEDPFADGVSLSLLGLREELPEVVLQLLPHLLFAY